MYTCVSHFAAGSIADLLVNLQFESLNLDSVLLLAELQVK